MSLALRLRKHMRAATNLGAVLIGNIVSAGLGFVVLLLLTRTLTPAEFGVLAPITSFLEIGQVVIETSVVAGAVQVAARYLGRDPARAQMAFKIGSVMRSAVGVALSAVGLVAAPWIAESLFGSQQWLPELLVMLFAVNLVAVYLSAMSVLLTQQLYWKLATATVIKNGMRVILVGALILASSLSVSSAVWAFAGAAAGSALISLFLAPPTFLKTPGWDSSIAREVISINKWAAIAGFAMLGTRIDIFMLSSLSSDVQVGIYASAFQLITVITIFSQSLSNFLFPKIVAYRTRREMRAHIRRVLVFAPAVVLPLPILLAVSGYLIPFLLGERYAPGVQSFDLLAVSAFISLTLNPVGLLLFPLGRTRTLAITNIGQLLVRIAFNFMLIPTYGAVGVALAEIISKIIISGVVIVLVCYDVYIGEPDKELSEQKARLPAPNAPSRKGD